jgi:hypothetical protein
MSSIRSREVARAQRPGVRHLEDALKALDFGNRLIGVHSVSISDMSMAVVKRTGRASRACEKPLGDLAAATSPTARHFCVESHTQTFFYRWFESGCVPPKQGPKSI